MHLNILKPGALVDVVAPASRATASELRLGVAALKGIGLRARVPKGIFAPSKLFSNQDEVRLAQLKAALTAEDSDLIWCVRGGYGSLRLLPELARMKKPRRPKLLLGYSDITSLHVFLNQGWGWPTLHGPLLDRFGGTDMGASERRQLLSVLFGRVEEIKLGGLRPLNAAGRRPGRVRGVVCGGNFAVLQSGLGTPYAIETAGKIVFLEDTGERPHRVDRMLTQFAQAGLFSKARAVVFGYFRLANPRDRRDLWNDVVARFADSQRIPVLKGLKVGHDATLQLTLPLGTPAELTLGERGSLSVQL